MSRHVVRRDDTYIVVVGYDDPLDTYFAQVYDVQAEKNDGEEHFLVNTGNRAREVTDPMECIGSVREYIGVAPVKRLADLMDAHEVIGELVVQLTRERRDRREPTDFQRNTYHDLIGEDLP